MRSFIVVQDDGNQQYPATCVATLSLHRAPTPEPDEDPLPGEHPVPQQDPVPSPFPEIPIAMASAAYFNRQFA